MKLVSLRFSNFRSFSSEPTEIELDEMTFLLGPNGAGKTAVLQGLARMFGSDPAHRKIQRSDFHVSVDEEEEEVPETRALWIEADFEFPELEDEEEGGVEEAVGQELPAVAAHFAHMRLVAEDGPALVRFRLSAALDVDGDIEEDFICVTSVDDDGDPLVKSRVSKQDRNSIQVHYLPARRDPSSHISYSTNALLGRLLRSANWTAERVAVGALTKQISESLEGNAAITGVAEALKRQWDVVHKGSYYADPALSFGRREVEGLLKHLSLSFSPGHGEQLVDFSRLSDGQQSLLYISLVLAAHDIGAKVLTGELGEAFDVDKLRPAVFTLIAIEEPENSLSPHYLGRVVKSVSAFSRGRDSQAVIATHSPALLRRVPPESVRYLRLDEHRNTVVSSVELPSGDAALKYVREAVKAFPELYFSRLVILGEGDSEEVVLPRILAARGILADDVSVSVVPLGGRHVNHFWRLLHGLGIPHVTLLDLDLARYQGGWGRVKYAAKQLRLYNDVAESEITEEEVNEIPAWDGDAGFVVNDLGWTERLENHDVFFSSPLDLDFMMMRAFPEAYQVGGDDLMAPDDDALKAVLGKAHDVVEDQYTVAEQSFFDAYHSRFNLGSKPSRHIRALANMDDDELAGSLPEALASLLNRVEEKLAEYPE